MNKKQLLMYGVIALILAALIYSQVRTFRHFDWATFWSQTDQVSGFHLLHAVVLIYLTYILRALRWKIFLRPSRPSAKLGSLVGPTMIGFTGLALLGRPGELIRPYLIARKNDLSFPRGLGGGAHLRYRGVHNSVDADHFRGYRTQTSGCLCCVSKSRDRLRGAFSGPDGGSHRGAPQRGCSGRVGRAAVFRQAGAPR
ncbi:MAG: hypothetical protein DMG90_03170 [Acidobacteria bacterium]|nr:MAG: hypothetical protein DMG90_03170 [Acidobacteriota bacterium]